MAATSGKVIRKYSSEIRLRSIPNYILQYSFPRSSQALL